MKKILFTGYNINTGEKVEEEMTFDDNATEKEIQDEYEQWVWELIGDYFSWDEA